ncbi:MAG: carbohydrate ABC transporter permease [Clostridia bacterium]
MRAKKEHDFLAISRPTNAVITLLLFLTTVVCVLPLLLIYSISFSSEASISQYGYSFWPREFSLSAYNYLMKTGDQLVQSYFITIVVTLLGTAISLFVVSMFAYVISRRDFRYRGVFAFFVFFTMLFNGGMVPSYIINVNMLHLNDTIWALILPLLVNGFYIMVMRTFYSTTIPVSILDAAKIDGAGEFRTFFRIVAPLSKPAFATVGLFTMIGYWNDWMMAMLYITNQKLAPIQYTLMKVQNNLEFVKQSAKYLTSVDGMQLAMNTPTDSAQMALTVLVATPLLVAYPLFQKYFVKGLTIGGVKE